MLPYINEIFYLLGPDYRKLPAICLLFTTASMLDLAGLGLIGPYVTLVVDPDSMDSTLGSIIDYLGLPRDQQQLIIMLSLCLFGIFLLKAFSAISINWIIIRFSQQQQLRLRSFLMKAYQELPYTEYLHRNSAEYIDSINRLTGQFASVILVLLRNTSDCIVGLVILSFLAWTNGLALALLVGLVGTMVLGYDRLFRKRLKNHGLQVNQASRSMLQGIHEGIEDTVHHGRIEVESRVGEGTTVTTILSYGFTGFGPAMTRGFSSTAPLRARLPRPGAQIPIAVVVDAQTLFAQVVEQLDWINAECASAQWQGRIRNDPVTRR